MKLENSSKSGLSVKDFLFLLLVQFPEIFTINYNLLEEQFKLTFLLQTSEGKYGRFIKKFYRMIKVYSAMRGERIYSLKVYLGNVKSWKLLQVSWKKENMTYEDVNLIIELVVQEFSNELVIENRNYGFDDMNYQKDLNLNSSENLFAYREAGKVHVLHK